MSTQLLRNMFLIPTCFLFASFYYFLFFRKHILWPFLQIYQMKKLNYINIVQMHIENASNIWMERGWVRAGHSGDMVCAVCSSKFYACLLCAKPGFHLSEFGSEFASFCYQGFPLQIECQRINQIKPFELFSEFISEILTQQLPTNENFATFEYLKCT